MPSVLLSDLLFAAANDDHRFILFHHSLFSGHLRGMVQIQKIELSSFGGRYCAEASVFPVHEGGLCSLTQTYKR